jgi:cell division protease FtsH
MALGQTQQLPLNDKYTYSKTYLDAQLAVLMAGRISEETFLGILTTGAGNDFEKATSIAHKMVCEWGMSSLGPLTFGRKEDMIFLGRDLMSHNEYSEETSQQIDFQVKKIIDEAYGHSKKIILENREKLEIIALQLLEKESLTSDNIAAILGTQKKPDLLQPKKKKNKGDSKPQTLE